MSAEHRWSRALVIVGVVAMLLGALDPLEGSMVILLGAGCAALGASLSDSRDATLSVWSFTLVLLGVGIMWALSAMGGVGGSTGRSYWWALVILPYPVGWVLGLVGAYRELREARRMSPA